MRATGPCPEPFLLRTDCRRPPAAAFSIGTAKPMPTKTRWSVGIEDRGDDADHLAVAIDQRAAGIAGIGRGVELDQVGQQALALVGRDRYSRFSPETTPADTDGPMPKGKPTATTLSPGSRSRGGAQRGGLRSSGESWPGARRGRSPAGRDHRRRTRCRRQKVTTQRSAAATTCRLVRMTPLSTITTPLPVESGCSSLLAVGRLGGASLSLGRP